MILAGCWRRMAGRRRNGGDAATEAPARGAGQAAGRAGQSGQLAAAELPAGAELSADVGCVFEMDEVLDDVDEPGHRPVLEAEAAHDLVLVLGQLGDVGAAEDA